MDFSNTSGIRSPFSPRVRQSISGRRPGLSSVKKNQSKYMQSGEAPTGDVIYKTPLTTLETFGHPLPVLVTEALTFASGEVTVRLSPNGYCWLVCGRRLLCWARDGGGAARELTLPQTDLQHRAELVEVFYEDGAQMPSCIGVSPEGVVRYWPSVGQELYADTSCELAGQECAKLCAATAGLLLATTSCSLLMLHPDPSRVGVTCQPLRPPSGWLGGLGRRVSLLFFGSMPASSDTKLVGVVILEEGGVAGAGAGLRGAGDVNSLQVVCVDVRAGAGRSLLLLIAVANVARSPEMRYAIVPPTSPLAGAGRSLLLLIAVANVARSPEMRYAIAHMSVEDPANPVVTSLVALRGAPAGEGARGCWPEPPPRSSIPPHTSPGSPGRKDVSDIFSRFAVADINAGDCTMGNDKVEYIDVSAEGDRILGAEMCSGRPLLFSRKHGVLVLTAAEGISTNVSMCESPMGSPCPSDMYDGNLSLYEIDPNEVSMVTTDACGKLKTAFLFHVRRDAAACRAIVEELFPAKQRDKEQDSALDRTVVRIATELCDDVPQGDPRNTGLIYTCLPIPTSQNGCHSAIED
ncbi:hypothetical protein MSG28_007204 [Choristoneura fumiferana]|uniref:Uncharacterized protein n=1 Tax=Choristoneura fumiferana TaxID=7141 RepID=A0ACC0JMZ0_CHOFU|nr:hypothetical protein MSG28_007204 [Choristoneura fumiferana]